MKVSTVTFKHAQVTNYERSYKGEEATLKIVFNDGSQDSSVEKRVSVNTNVEELSLQTLDDIRKLVKGSGTSSRDFLGDVVVVKFDDDETMQDRLEHAFSRIKEDIRKLKSTTSGSYLQTMSNFRNAKYSLQKD